MSNDEMMKFRTSYLHAIAWAWEREERYKEMVSSEARKLFEKLGVPFPEWNIEILFRPPSDAAHSVVTPGGDGYRPLFAGRWVGPKPVMKLPFPEAPSAQPTLALAEFYRALPTPFGPNTSGGEGGQGGQGMGPVSDALVLGATLMRAVALYWSPPDDNHRYYVQDLFGGDGKPKPSSINTALAKWIGYSCPWNMELVAERSNAKWNGKAWNKAPKCELTLYVPEKPEVKNEAFALAAYNETGGAYPLTCP